MSVKYPVKGKNADALFDINEKGNNGWFPIGLYNFWHGGINLNFPDKDSGSKPIRAIANGRIIAYRLTDDYKTLEETYDDDGSKKKYYERKFSNNFVLIKHEIKTPKKQTIEFYSLYMHLLPFKFSKEKYDKKEVSIFKQWKFKVKSEPNGAGDNLRNKVGTVIKVIPKGVSVIENPDGDTYNVGKSDKSKRLAVTCGFWDQPVEGFIWKPSFTHVGNIDGKAIYRCAKTPVTTGSKVEKGLNVYENNNSSSEVVKIVPKGTELFFDESYDVVSEKGKIKHDIVEVRIQEEEATEAHLNLGLPARTTIGWIPVNDQNIETEGKVIDPTIVDEIQTDDIEIRGGDIIGWPGNDGVSEKNSFHFEVFAKKDKIFGKNGFWGNPKKDGKEDGVIKIKKGASFSSMSDPDPIKIDIPKDTVVQLDLTIDKVGKHPAKDYRRVKSIKKFVFWVERWELHYFGKKSNKDIYRLVKEDTPDRKRIDKAWRFGPATLQDCSKKRDLYVGVPLKYNENATEMRLLEQKDIDTGKKDSDGHKIFRRFRKVEYVVKGYTEFKGWIKKQYLETHTYRDKGVKEYRYKVIEELKHKDENDKKVFSKSPENVRFGTIPEVETYSKAKQDLFILKKDCITKQCDDKKTWIGIPRDLITDDKIWFEKEDDEEVKDYVWIEKEDSNIEKFNLFKWENFFTKCEEKSAANAEDGFCDAKSIFDLIYESREEKEKEELYKVIDIKDAVKHKTFKFDFRELVVEHPSGWFFPTSEDNQKKKWKNRLMGSPIDPNRPKVTGVQDRYIKHRKKFPKYGFNFSEPKYKAFLEVARSASFLNNINGFTEDEKLWYFHPVAFVQHLKRIFDQVIFPFDKIKNGNMDASGFLTESVRQFGSRRSGGTRAHAGVDLYAPDGTDILAIKAGTIIDHRIYLTKKNGIDEPVYALTIDHEDFVVRYCEIENKVGDLPNGLKKGSKVKQGEAVGQVGLISWTASGNEQSMLHFELYDPGVPVGSWYQKKSVSKVCSSNNLPFYRHNKLKDPTDFLKKLL